MYSFWLTVRFVVGWPPVFVVFGHVYCFCIVVCNGCWLAVCIVVGWPSVISLFVRLYCFVLPRAYLLVGRM